MIPEALTEAIEQELSHFSSHALKAGRISLSTRYREGASQRMNNDEERLSYIVTRMPATLAVMEKVLAQINLEGKTILDVGAGPGTLYWAAPDVAKITHIEQDNSLISMGKRLSGHAANSVWVHGNALTLPFTPHDIALFSYSFNEAVDLTLMDKAWEACRTIVLIEPGTPRGFQNILLARGHLKKLGAHMVAPCPHYEPCPLVPPDWCHFGVRVNRSRLHKELKGGTLGYEDEKYSYLIVSKTLQDTLPDRILAPPEKHSGHMALKLCTPRGVEKRTLSKKDGSIYKAARKLEWGDSIPDNEVV